MSGRVVKISGLASLEELPSLVEYRLYDDVGSSVMRPPTKSHASGYAAFTGSSFTELEDDACAAQALVRIEVG